MSFQQKYQIQFTLSDGEFRVFRALEISSGRPVLIHHLSAPQVPLLQSELTLLIFRFLRSDPSQESQYFLDMGEDEGRIYVVTADMARCLDLRQWLQSVIDAPRGKASGAQPAEGSPGLGSVNSTRTFTIESFREVLAFGVGASDPPSPPPLARGPNVLPVEISPGDSPAPSEFYAVSSEVTDSSRAAFAGYYQEPSPANLAGHPSSVPMPPPSPESLDSPYDIAEVTEKVLLVPAPLVDLDTAMLTVPSPQAKGSAAQLADFVMTSSHMKSAVRPSAPEVPKPSPPPAATPAAYVPGRKTPEEFTGRLPERIQALQQATAPSSPSRVNDKPEASTKSTVKVPRPEVSGGFDMVFQSSKPPLAPTAPGMPGVPPAGSRTAAIPVVSAPAPSRAPSVNVPAPQPSIYVTYDTPLYSAGSKRKNWVPILILSSLFLMTVALLLFYAFKH